LRNVICQRRVEIRETETQNSIRPRQHVSKCQSLKLTACGMASATGGNAPVWKQILLQQPETDGITRLPYVDADYVLRMATLMDVVQMKCLPLFEPSCYGFNVFRTPNTRCWEAGMRNKIDDHKQAHEHGRINAAVKFHESQQTSISESREHYTLQPALITAHNAPSFFSTAC